MYTSRLIRSSKTLKKMKAQTYTGKGKYKMDDHVIINPVRASHYRKGVQNAIGTVVGITSRKDRLVYMVRFSDSKRLLSLTAYDLRPAPQVQEPIQPIQENKQTTDERTLKVSLETAREWYQGSNKELRELALRLFTKEELTSSKPKSWHELCSNFIGKVFRRTICNTDEPNIVETYCDKRELGDIGSTGICMPTKELMEKYFALGKLIFLHYVWTGGWQPDWDNDKETKYVISTMSKQRWCIVVRLSESRALCFKTHEDANEFATVHKDLLNKALGLY